MTKAAPLPTKRYAALAPIGIHDDEDDFVVVRVGQLVELTEAQHAELLALKAVAEEPIPDPAV